MRMMDCIKLRVHGKLLIDIEFWKDDVVYETQNSETGKTIFVREQTHILTRRRRRVEYVPKEKGEA